MTPDPSPTGAAAPPGHAPAWQCVFLLWGERYGAGDVNHIAAAVRARARDLPRFVLLTDRPRPGLDPSIMTRPIPDFYLRPDFLTGGCQAKIALFEPGLLPTDLPAVYLDLDTVVLGDIGELVRRMPDPRVIAMLQSAILPFGLIGRLAARLTGGRKYARGNSSVLLFHPAHGAEVAARFRAAVAAHPDLRFRPLVADERFISWAAQPRMRRVPSSFAVKFPTEFMLPWAWAVLLRARLPWVRRRREGLRAITLPGPEVKPEVLADLAEGARLRDRKGRLLIWSDRALGSARAALIAHAHALAQARAEAAASVSAGSG
ncbi:MAG: hypothetical protein ACXIUV_12330 [Alkalilacustris sp.]